MGGLDNSLETMVAIRMCADVLGNRISNERLKTFLCITTIFSLCSHVL